MKSFYSLLLLLLVSMSVLSKEQILWYHPNFPPANFVEGIMAGLGHNDQAEKFISNQLSQYQHLYITASYQRIMRSLKFDHGCAVGIYQSPERQKKLIFSIPYLLTFPNGLIIVESEFSKFSPYLDNHGSISIKKLLDDERLIAGISDGRKYQGAIDVELNLHRSNDNILVRSSSDVFSGLLKMLDKKRIDYLFGFPEELEYHTSLGVLDRKMKFIPISEMPKFLTSYIVCSKDAWGQQLIHEINQVLRIHRATPEFLRFYEFWLDFESKKRHRNISTFELDKKSLLIIK